MFRSSASRFCLRSPASLLKTPNYTRTFTTTSPFKMPEPLKQSEIDKGQDPSVTKQWDDNVSLEQKMKDFGAIADHLKIGIMGSLREGVGVRFYHPLTSLPQTSH